MDFPALAKTYLKKNAFYWWAPALQIVVVSLRCNHKCLYCHSSAVDPSRTDMDMSLETARRAVDFILSTPSPTLMIEFQGGEPLLNWPVLRFVVEYAQERNKRSGKDLAISLVTNLTLMTEEKLDFLLSRGVAVCTSACAGAGVSCTTNDDCCTGECGGVPLTCQASPTACKTAGSSCTTDPECCTGTCAKGTCGCD